MTENSRDVRRAETANRILEAARAEFALQGFDGATIRSIAARAGVHASLVMQHYGTKAALFSNAARLPDQDHTAAADHLADVLGFRLADLPPETRALVRSMLTVPEAAESMKVFLDERVDNLAATIDGADAELRAAVIVSSILGLTIARHFLALRAFEATSNEALVESANAWVTTVLSSGAARSSRG